MLHGAGREIELQLQRVGPGCKPKWPIWNIASGSIRMFTDNYGLPKEPSISEQAVWPSLEPVPPRNQFLATWMRKPNVQSVAVDQ